MYLTPKLRETTIGEFIKTHANIIKPAFKTSHFEYEPYLKWIEKSDIDKDVAINPDLMIQRENGYYDIYDLKTALLDKNKLVKGERRRRRLVDIVEEGIAQLAHYKQYFDFEANCKYAKMKYNISVNNPKLVLIFGCFENFNKVEIDEATRRLDKNYHIIDYDTMAHMFIND